MRHKFNRSVFQDPAVYEVMIRTVLFGYAKNVSELQYAKDPSPTDYDTNAIVYGLTESSAKVRANDVFRSTNYLNIKCVGSDTDLDDLDKHLSNHRFNGHFIICPEIAHARDHVIAHLALTLDRVAADIDYRNGRWHRELHTLVPTKDVENDILWAMFEQWKIGKTRQRNIFIEDEKRRFNFYNDRRGNDYEVHEKRQKALACAVPPQHVAGTDDGLRIAPPHDLDPVKTFAAWRDREVRIDTKNLHPVRVGHDFDQFLPWVINDIICDLSPRPGLTLDDKPDSVRTVCVPDKILWNIFTEIVNGDMYYPPERRQGCCVESGDKIDEARIKTVYTQDLAKA